MALFFKKLTEEERKYTDKAAGIAFVFYLIALSISSLYSFFKETGFNLYFMILMVGLIIFFMSDFLFRKTKNMKNDKNHRSIK